MQHCTYPGSLLNARMRAQLCPTFCNPVDCSMPGSSVLGIFQAKNTGTGCHFLLQGIFLPQGLNLCLLHLLHWQVDSEPPGKLISCNMVSLIHHIEPIHSLSDGRPGYLQLLSTINNALVNTFLCVP